MLWRNMLPPSSWYKMEMEATFLFNISTFIPDYMVSHFKEQFSSIIKTPGVDIHSVLLGFLTFHILVFQREHVLETESVSILT